MMYGVSKQTVIACSKCRRRVLLSSLLQMSDLLAMKPTSQEASHSNQLEVNSDQIDSMPCRRDEDPKAVEDNGRDADHPGGLRVEGEREDLMDVTVVDNCGRDEGVGRKNDVTESDIIQRDREVGDGHRAADGLRKSDGKLSIEDGVDGVSGISENTANGSQTAEGCDREKEVGTVEKGSELECGVEEADPASSSRMITEQDGHQQLISAIEREQQPQSLISNLFEVFNDLCWCVSYC